MVSDTDVVLVFRGLALAALVYFVFSAASKP